MSISNILKTGLTQREYIILGATAVVGASLVFAKHYFAGALNQVTRDLTGKVVIITGGHTGIGKETARELARVNATLIIAAHDPKHAEATVEELKRLTNNQKIEYMQLDLGDLTSIEEFVKNFKSKYDRVDILINNATITSDKMRTITRDGYESQLGYNHIGPFYLTKLLMQEIKKAEHSRVITVSSKGQAKGKINWDDILLTKDYNGPYAYSQAKLANIIFTKELQRRFDLELVNSKAVALDPGVVRATLGEHHQQKFLPRLAYFISYPLIFLLTKNPKQGAQTTLYCALEDHTKLHAGGFYKDCMETKVNSRALEDGAGARLWKLTDELLASR